MSTFGIEGLPYAITQSHFDSSGQLISETFQDGAGAIYRQRTIVANGNGSTTTTDIDATGAVVGRDIQNADGSRQFVWYDDERRGQ